ncbi:hypothetical protein M011DRAFT_82174 [Sporormia fimetaria CBS 119925]|uniref:Uncharacterized protein n=1 Tax=Sporormia fimetaria CBS 119925 TaxID=1340428 RepID=A0A6A6V9T2_9PLEO|nr:hypothetical protein M011DRAFT_82174 [Sporormia fimetaria CBS 119925]
MGESCLSLLSFPLEIRFLIYDYLCGTEPECFRMDMYPVSSIAFGPPPRSLLLSCRQIHTEVQHHYYSIATLRLTSLGFVQPRTAISSRALFMIRQARRVELVLQWNVFFPRGTVGPAHEISTRNRRWLQDQVALIVDEGQNIKTILVSLRDPSPWGDWASKKPVLEPLELLRGRAYFARGEVIASARAEKEITVRLTQYLHDLNRSLVSS